MPQITLLEISCTNCGLTGHIDHTDTDNPNPSINDEIYIDCACGNITCRIIKVYQGVVAR